MAAAAQAGRGHGADDPLVVGIMYPAEWEVRPAEQLQGDFDALRAIDPRIEIVDVRYVEDDALRARRGASPGEDLRHLAPELTPEQVDAFARVEVVLAQDLPFDVASHAPNLRWVQGMGAGVSQLVSAGLDKAGAHLTSAAGVNAVSIAEFVLARLLQVWKRLPEIEALQQAHEWRPTYGKEVAGSTLGVVGLGAIGRQVARRGRALGMRVVASRRTATAGQVDPDVDELVPADQLHRLLAASDAVVAAVPESPATTNLFGAAEFATMPAGSIFVNVGRGSAVDEDALVAALGSGHLRAAALDVVVGEPLDAGSPLWDVPGLYLSPHNASSPDRFWSNLYGLFGDNLRRYLAGDALANEMDTAVDG